MAKSIFWKITLIILPVVLLADAVILAAAYRITYNAKYEDCLSRIKTTSAILEEQCTRFNFEEEEDVRYLDKYYNYVCTMMDFPYVYAVQLDLKKNTETYLCIGFGEDAVEEARSTRYAGVVVEGLINSEERAVTEGGERIAIRHEENRFGETLICYTSLKRRYNSTTKEYEDVNADIIIGVEISVSLVMKEFYANAAFLAGLTVSLSVVIVLAFAVILHRKISRPARVISSRMTSFVEDYNRGFQKLEVKGRDEFADVSRSFNTMAENIDSYLKSITELNREKHMREAEMDIAAGIQQGLLPAPHFRSDGFTIDAYMLPARDGPGDLYDYRVLDDGRIFLTVADVSGKSISAALFVSCAITLLHMYAQLGCSPAEMLAKYNNSLTELNPNGLFITTFAAVADPEAETLTYSNAGHNFPYILSDSLHPLDGAHGVAAGVFPDLTYEEVTVPFKRGDCLFLYTDGVNEAQNADGELFTTEALEEELRRRIGGKGEDLIRAVLNRLNAFTCGAPQSDDVTMLTFQADAPLLHRVLRLPAQKEQLTAVAEAIDLIPAVSDEVRMKLHVIAEEMFINICSYAYEDNNGQAEITIDVTEQKATLIFADTGRPFDPTDKVVTLDEYEHLKQKGGLGRFITFQFADEYRYTRTDGKNVLRITLNNA